MKQNTKHTRCLLRGPLILSSFKYTYYILTYLLQITNVIKSRQSWYRYNGPVLEYISKNQKKQIQHLNRKCLKRISSELLWKKIFSSNLQFWSFVNSLSIVFRLGLLCYLPDNRSMMHRFSDRHFSCIISSCQMKKKFKLLVWLCMHCMLWPNALEYRLLKSLLFIN